MKKKVVSLMLVAAMACSMAACGSSNADAGKTDSAAESTTGSDSAASTEAASTGETANGALKIAIVSSPSGVDDGSFNEDNYNGIQNFIKENPDSTVTPIQETTGDTDAAVQAVADIVADYDVIVCCGFQFAGIGTIAQDNPDVKFILVDSFPTDADGNTI